MNTHIIFYCCFNWIEKLFRVEMLEAFMGLSNMLFESLIYTSPKPKIAVFFGNSLISSITKFFKIFLEIWDRFFELSLFFLIIDAGLWKIFENKLPIFQGFKQILFKFVSVVQDHLPLYFHQLFNESYNTSTFARNFVQGRILPDLSL